MKLFTKLVNDWRILFDLLSLPLLFLRLGACRIMDTQHHILRHGYHGGGYDGNNSKRLLENCEKMRLEMPNSMDCWPAIDALVAFREVVHGEKKY